MAESLCHLPNKTEGLAERKLCGLFEVGWEIQLEIENSSFYSRSSPRTKNIFVNCVWDI